MSRRNSHQAKAARRVVKTSRFRHIGPGSESAFWLNDNFGLECDVIGLFTDDVYNVTVFARQDGQIRFMILNPLDGSSPGWADKQAIKNDLAGKDAWAYELYPAENSLIDAGGSNYWLWIINPGEEEFFTPMTGQRIVPGDALPEE